MDFIISPPVLTNQQKPSYKSILVIINWLTIIVYNKHIKIIISISELAKVLIHLVI